MSPSVTLKTVEITLPAEEFDAVLNFYTKPKRRDTEPLPAIDMARDSTSGYSGQSRRNSSYSVPQFAMSKSQISRGNSASAVQPVSSSTPGVRRAPSGYADSNVTGYRRTLDVDGLPPPDYFNSGASKYDRRPEYVGQQAYRQAPSMMSARCKSYTGGQQIVSYTGSQQTFFEQPETYDGDANDDDDDDTRTVEPWESISNSSSRRSSEERPSYPSSRRSYQRESLPPISCRRASSYAEGGVGSAYGRGGGYSAVGSGYQIVERRPRAKA